ncbi:hypothetical protein HCG49_14085 [Arenibacter sp. 6A1]|uniref:DUF6503 family protein n=1 Tax=Arenibacter sp. 6A1 TaxID=2720391 RepID=UPI00144837BE|nr:DUF6503 family protein [Arenibacter sp. 6A1]NKI27694.1 hypothetical protein [Arenibacter sp. 6A1]
MKYIMLILLLVGIMGCNGEGKDVTRNKIKETKEQQQSVMSQYPPMLAKVFEAHGGMATWKRKKSMVFQLGEEVHTLNLSSRMDRVDGPGYSMGFNGSKVWLLNEGNTYKGDPVFYHNLMTYFYSMPFILGDNGIVYEKTEDLVFKGVSYPGFRIGFHAGVGITPKDEYYIHYDPKTFKMAWLGYTVSYRSGERSDNVKWIGYHNWMDVDGVLMPRELTWYEYEGRTIKEPKTPLVFKNVVLSEEAKPVLFFEKPERAVYVSGKKRQ